MGVAVHTLPPADDMSEEEVFRLVRGVAKQPPKEKEAATEEAPGASDQPPPSTAAEEVAPEASASPAVEAKDEDVPPAEKMEDLSLDDDNDSLKEAPPEPMDTHNDAYKIPQGRPGSLLPKADTSLEQDTRTSFVQPGQEVEIVHELMLVSLGLGQYRASDGATTIFEQDGLFHDDAEVMDISASQPATPVPKHARGPSVEESIQSNAEVAALEQRAEDTPSEHAATPTEKQVTPPIDTTASFDQNTPTPAQGATTREQGATSSAEQTLDEERDAPAKVATPSETHDGPRPSSPEEASPDQVSADSEPTKPDQASADSEPNEPTKPDQPSGDTESIKPDADKPSQSDEGTFLSVPPLPSRTPSPIADPSPEPQVQPQAQPESKTAPPPLPPRLPPRPKAGSVAAPAASTSQAAQPSSGVGWSAPKKFFGSLVSGLGGQKSPMNSASKAPPNGPDSSASQQDSAQTTSGPAQGESKLPKPKEPVKPNEIFHYDARSRAIIFQTLRSMGLEAVNVYQGEKVLAQSIYFLVQEGQRVAKERGKGDIFGSDSSDSRGAWMNRASSKVLARERNKGNWGKWAAAGVGFTLAGVLTGGLAAPILAPVLVGLGAGYLATTGGVVLMGTLLGLGGGGLAGYRVERRLRGLDRFRFEVVETPAAEAGVTIPSLHATICVSGLLTDASQQTAPWKSALAYLIPDPRDIYAVQFETDLMVEAGTGLQRYVTSQLIRSGGTHAATEVIKTTAFAGLAALTLPLTVMSVASAALDSTFMRAKTKAHKAGLVLAETLRNEVQGHRPVVLIGVSLGVTTVLSALVELAAKDPESDAQLIDSVYLVGGPTIPSTRTIKKARSVVARRFVNAWSSKDMVCGIAAFLGSGLDIQDLRDGKVPRVLGSGPIELGVEEDDLGRPVKAVENIDVSEVISSHSQLNDEGHLAAVLARCNAFVG